MYTPSAYDADDPKLLHRLMREWSFAVLFSQAEGSPMATHLPVLTEPGGAHGLGRLTTHIARANPHWRHFEDDAPVLAVFSGPNAYVSVNWYDGQQTFPTWNYGAIHATGRVTLEQDPEKLRHLLNRTLAAHDAPLGGSWRFDAVDPDKTNRLLRGIVGLTVEIETLEGKLKYNQDKPAKDRARVAEALLKRPETAEAGRFMQRLARETEGEIA